MDKYEGIYVYKYILENDLYEVILEFSIFNEDVAINKEKIIVYELRNNY